MLTKRSTSVGVVSAKITQSNLGALARRGNWRRSNWLCTGTSLPVPSATLTSLVPSLAPCDGK